MPPKRALGWVAVWISLALIFAVGIFYFRGPQAGMEFLTCYLIEWTLSVDNLFVFLMVFEAFGVDEHRQLRALKWGIIGAMLMRLVFITLGVAVVHFFEPVLYIFGAILIYSAFMMFVKRGGRIDARKNRLVLLVQRYFPITDGFVGDAFIVRRDAGLVATPMLLVLVAIESSDLMFAIDSIPAAFAITRNPFIIFAANIFAILGLRSLYFLLAHADRLFRFLRYGVAVVLAFVGIKMLIVHFYTIDTLLSLGVVMGVLGGAIAASLIVRGEKRQ